MTGSQRIAIVGGSLAGLRAAEAVRRQGFDGTVTLVGAERHFPPVDRPPLSKAFLTAEPGTHAAVLRADPDLELVLRLGRRAVGLEPSRHVVHLDDDSTLDYDGLIIATGSTVRRLPDMGNHDNVHVLRTVEDATRLRADLRPGARVAVIGAGVLGCEIAAGCRQLGLDVALIDVFPQPMLRVLGPQVGQLLADLHQRNGVRMLLGQHVLGLRGQAVADAVLLDDEVVGADVVVVAIGAFPETRWLEESGLELADGVMCNQECFALGGDHIVAAGDVARWQHRLLGEHIRVEHWTNAVSQGQAAGRNLVAALRGPDAPVPYEVLPYFWSDQYDWKLQFVGLLGEQVTFEEGERGDSRFVVSYRTQGRLVGALCVNWPSKIAPWRRTIVEASMARP